MRSVAFVRATPDGTGVNYVFDDIQVQVTNERGFVTNYLYQVRC